jgi:hypothetical protein
LQDAPAASASEDTDTITHDTLILNALAYRDTVEHDPAVMDFVTASLADAARHTAKRKLVIEAIATQNRRLHRQFVAAMQPIETLLHIAVLRRIAFPDLSARNSKFSRVELMSKYFESIDIGDNEANAIFAQREDLPLYVAVRIARAKELTRLPGYASSPHFQFNWASSKNVRPHVYVGFKICKRWLSRRQELLSRS